MEITKGNTKTPLTKNNKIAEALIEELQEDLKEKVFDSSDIFSNSGNEQYIFNTKIKKLCFRIDCAPANDEKHPNKGNKTLMYLQVQDSQTPSGTYANVVYPKDAKAEDIVCAIIESLENGEGRYLVC